MTDAPALVVEADAEARWRAWQARGMASNRRSAARVRVAFVVICAALGLWLAVRLV